MRTIARLAFMLGITVATVAVTPIAVGLLGGSVWLATRDVPCVAWLAASVLLGFVGMLASWGGAVVSGLAATQQPRSWTWRAIEAGHYATFMASALPIAAGLPLFAIVTTLAAGPGFAAVVALGVMAGG